MSLYQDALTVAARAVKAADPYDTTCEALRRFLPGDGAVTVFSIGKAAIPMAQAAADVLGGRIEKGLVVTKYGHTGDFASPYFEVVEAAHPVSDENSVKAAEAAGMNGHIAKPLNIDSMMATLRAVLGGGTVR